MTRTRIAILVLGPWPILAASIALSTWMRASSDGIPASNNVLRSPQWTSTAAAAEFTANKPRRTTSASLAALCRDSGMRLEKKLGDACPVIVRSPFVIAGDMTTDELEHWHRRTIAPAAEALANCYCVKQPTQPITVLLFTGEESYNKYAKQLFGESGISVYGYYKPNVRTLMMNIGTGGGTLVHELTHALVDFDFTDVPDWFNEGLASLHEQCQFRSSDSGPWIEGLENWRLAGLQRTIKQKRLRPLKTMIEANDFRGELEGTNYAQARYFCLYLQRKDLLRPLYRTMRDTHDKDPLGVAAVASLFDQLDWPQLDRDFQKWVMTLRF